LNDPSNWWVPTIRCLYEWVESSYFDVLQEFLPPQVDRKTTLAERLRRKRVPPEPQFSRAVLTACAAVRHDPKYILPDGELAVFDRDAASARTG
jgi:hypothetical protein